MKKHLLAIALFALCTTGLNAASPKKVAPEKKGVETINRATAEAHIGFLACDDLEGLVKRIEDLGYHFQMERWTHCRQLYHFLPETDGNKATGRRLYTAL